MKILLIDDNQDITTMIHKYLTIKGHSCLKKPVKLDLLMKTIGG